MVIDINNKIGINADKYLIRLELTLFTLIYIYLI